MDGRPTPSASSSFTSVASVKRGGGSVKCCSGSIDLNFSVSPSVDRRQLVLQLLVFLVLLVLAFLVDRQEAVELRHAAGGAEQVRRAVLALGVDVDGGLVEHRRRHLRGDEAHPDQPVELELVLGQVLLDRLPGVRSAEVGRMASCASCASFLLL